MFDAANWLVVLQNREIFLSGWLQTIIASLLAMLLASLLGVVAGAFSLAPVAPLRWIHRAYVEFFRNTPLLVQVFFLYYGLPQVGVVIPTLWVGVLGLGVYTGAYIAEVLRGGFQAVPRGQMEAGLASGLSYAQVIRTTILPQALRFSLPPLTNQFVNMVKNSQVLSMIAGFDLMYQADSWSSQTALYGQAYVTAALLYLILTLPLATLARRLERRLNSPPVRSSDGLAGAGSGGVGGAGGVGGVRAGGAGAAGPAGLPGGDLL